MAYQLSFLQLIILIFFVNNSQGFINKDNNNFQYDKTCGNTCQQCTLEQSCRESPLYCSWDGSQCITQFSIDDICDENCDSCENQNSCNTSPANCAWSLYDNSCKDLCSDENCGGCLIQNNCISFTGCSWQQNQCVNTDKCEGNCNLCQNKSQCQESLLECGFIDNRCSNYCEVDCGNCKNENNCKASRKCTWIQDQCTEQTPSNTCALKKNEYECNKNNDCFWDSYYKQCYPGNCDQICSLCNEKQGCENSEAICVFDEYDKNCEFATCDDGKCNLCRNEKQCQDQEECVYDEQNNSCAVDDCGEICSACKDLDECEESLQDCFFAQGGLFQGCVERQCGAPCGKCFNQESCEHNYYNYDCVWKNNQCQYVPEPDICDQITSKADCNSLQNCYYLYDTCISYQCASGQCEDCAKQEYCEIKSKIEHEEGGECEWENGFCQSSFEIQF